MMAGAEQRLKELGIKLPAPPEPFGAYVEAVQTGNLLFLSGMLPTEGHDGEIHRARRRGARCGSGAQCGSPRGAQRPRCCAAAFGIARQSDADRPARRVGGHFGRCPRSAESRRRALRSCCRTSSEKTRALAAWCMASQAFRSAPRSSWKSFSRLPGNSHGKAEAKRCSLFVSSRWTIDACRSPAWRWWFL